MKIILLGFAGLLPLASLVIAHTGFGATPRPPNVVVIVSDDQGYADLSFNPHHRSP